MAKNLKKLFLDIDIVNRIKSKMPYLFQLAEMECSRAGKLGMEVGSARERIIIALLMYKFGEENIETDVPITKPEIDVFLYQKPISIKTVSGNLAGVKLIWTVDRQKVLEFYKSYYPSMDMLLAQISWGGIGHLYYFPPESQKRIFERIGRKNYIKLPKQGTNPRGVEISKKALELLAQDDETIKIDINWDRKEFHYDIYDRWIELWADRISTYEHNKKLLRA
jgi:hypothetical protein